MNFFNMDQRLYHWCNYFISGILWLLGFGMMGCTPQGDEYGPEPVEYGPPNPVDQFEIDEDFKATLEYLQGAWAAEYEGWDDIQKCNTTIRRKLELNPDGTYSNLIAGKMPKTGDDQFFKFESEGGTYTYDYTSSIITYTCRYDSILVIHNQNYSVYNRKHYFDHEVSTYTEKVLFTVEKNGKRGWITHDSRLVSTTDNSLPVVCWMNRYDGDEPQKDQ